MSDQRKIRRQFAKLREALHRFGRYSLGMKTPRRASRPAKRLVQFISSPTITEPDPSTPNSHRPEIVPPRWAWHFRALTQLRGRLQRAHAEHSSEASTPPDAGGFDAADTAQDRLDRDLLWAELGARPTNFLKSIAPCSGFEMARTPSARKRADRFRPERLRAVPWTRYCRIAAEAHEARTPRAK